jgi:branched-chain amino acid aminotransferase
LPRRLARDEARARGCDDALLSDESGRIVEAATGSVFAVVGDALVTASVLEGITRMHVLELARAMGMDCALGPLEARDVERASELFVTSSLREIVPVVRLDDRAIGEGTPGEKTRALLRAYRELTAA